MKKLILVLAILLGSFANAQDFDFGCIIPEELREIRKADILSLNSARITFDPTPTSDAYRVTKSINTWIRIQTKTFGNNTIEGLTELKYTEFKNRIISQLELYGFSVNN